MADDPFSDEMDEEPSPLGVAFGILLGVLFSLPPWGGIIWLASMIW